MADLVLSHTLVFCPNLLVTAKGFKILVCVFWTGRYGLTKCRGPLDCVPLTLQAERSKPTNNAGMSHAPVCRKSQKALTAAAASAASTKPAPHLVVLRVKRKRGDASVDSLVVSTDEATSNENDVPDRKRRAGTETIEDTLAFLSINKAAEERRQHHVDQTPSRLFYKRVRTTESDGSNRKSTTSRVVAPTNGEHGDVVETAGTGGGPLDTRLVSDADAALMPPPPSALDYLEVRRIKARAVGTATDSGHGSGHGIPSSSDHASSASDFHVIDLQAVGRSSNSIMHVTGTGDTSFGGKTAATPSAAPVLNPVERQMDEAIFKVSFGCSQHVGVDYQHVGVDRRVFSCMLRS